MESRYPYLKNKHAREEIRKHKWIESEKRGSDIGFATAAVDWIKRYGLEWKSYYVDLIEEREKNHG